MDLTSEQKFEKAIQHTIVFAMFASREFCRDAKTPGEVLLAAFERINPPLLAVQEPAPPWMET